MTAEAEVGLEARAICAVVELTEAGKAESEVGLEARAAESVVEAGVEAGINTLPVEAENEVGSGAMNTSSLRSAEALSTPAPEPVEEYIKDANEFEGGSSNYIFMSIFLQSGVSRHPSHPTQPPPGAQRSPQEGGLLDPHPLRPFLVTKWLLWTVTHLPLLDCLQGLELMEQLLTVFEV